MGAYSWVLLGGAITFVLVVVLKARLVGFFRPIPRHIKLLGVAVFISSLIVPYWIELRGESYTFHGFPFLIFGQDKVGRVFSGLTSIFALAGNYFLWSWLVQLTFLRKIRRLPPDEKPALRE